MLSTNYSRLRLLGLTCWGLVALTVLVENIVSADLIHKPRIRRSTST